MHYFALACDFDQTLANRGVVARGTLDALERLLASGRKLVLVTGRQLDDLQQIFPQLSLFERVVAENGAVLFRPSTGETKLLAEPPSQVFLDALHRRGVSPLSFGSVIVASEQPENDKLLAVIRELGLELQVIYNKGAAMVLPSGVNKGTGLLAALSEMCLSHHNVVAIGDAENDHALLSACECGIAVFNALQTLRERADLTSGAADGKGVEEIIDRLLLDDLRGVRNRLQRQPIVLGTAADGTNVSIDSCDASLIIAGPSSSGKSTTLIGLLKRLTQSEFQVCLIDPEGDYSHVEDIVTLGGSERPPNVMEIFQILNNPKSSLTVNLLGLPLADRPLFFAALLPKLQELRAKTGRPHWIILNEAHQLLPRESGQAITFIPQSLTGVILITVHVEAVLEAALNSMTGIIAVGASPEETVHQFSNAVGVPPPIYSPLPNRPGDVFVWLLDRPCGPLAVRVQPPTSEIGRDRRKYAEGKLVPETSFFFRGPAGKLNLRAHNLSMFIQIAEGVDDETWLHHLRRGDYSQWIREVIQDQALANEVREIEKDGKQGPQKTRTAVIEAINRRYTRSE
ncbi:MAG: phosphoglycolate phosphatase [Acidobacteria bacterium]|nr:MAG: phosphoglycolate phosphatase [Acidobacteriota bacterium]